jgi:hypothetical protein
MTAKHDKSRSSASKCGLQDVYRWQNWDQTGHQQEAECSVTNQETNVQTQVHCVKHLPALESTT